MPIKFDMYAKLYLHLSLRNEKKTDELIFMALITGSFTEPVNGFQFCLKSGINNGYLAVATTCVSVCTSNVIADSLSAHIVPNRPHKLPISFTAHAVTERGGGGSEYTKTVMSCTHFLHMSKFPCTVSTYARIPLPVAGHTVGL
jgi:hypothetical protein